MVQRAIKWRSFQENVFLDPCSAMVYAWFDCFWNFFSIRVAKIPSCHSLTIERKDLWTGSNREARIIYTKLHSLVEILENLEPKEIPGENFFSVGWSPRLCCSTVQSPLRIGGCTREYLEGDRTPKGPEAGHLFTRAIDHAVASEVFMAFWN